MSWTNELYRVYDLAVEAGIDMLPISHSTANAQIEITVSEEGEFIEAAAVEKENAVTVIPVTEDSAARTSGIFPMPFADKLVYIAGDYPAFAEGKRADNSEFFAAYMKQLGQWCKSDNAHPAVAAVYAYLEKQQILHDLVRSGIIELDPVTGKFADKKISGIAQEDSFVRFIVSGRNGLCKTWLDEKFRQNFTEHYRSTLTETGLSYADGSISALTYKHPSKIRNSGDKAKLISANDSTNYTFRGRFANKEEAVAVSYEYSQKMHSALKYLISRQYISRTDKKGKTVTYNPFSFDSLQLLVWNSALGFVQSVTDSVFDICCDAEDYDPTKKFPDMLDQMLLHGKEVYDPDKKVMIMGLDAATTGRLSIAMYSELAESDFYKYMRKWHSETAWRRYNAKLSQTVTDSCSLPQIANCLYGTEQGGSLSCDKKLMGDLILRLLPCVCEGKPLPHDVVMILTQKASSPLSYEKEYNHRTVLENACALIRKEQAEHDNKLYYKGEIKMAYDPNCNDRSYLYGCLLAIADKAENDTYDKGESRVTNARRLWSAFAARPCQTWKIIEERLEPYLEKNLSAMSWYTQKINEIMAKMSPEDFADNSKLSPLYLIGFHHYNALLWKKNNENNEED